MRTVGWVGGGAQTEKIQISMSLITSCCLENDDPAMKELEKMMESIREAISNFTREQEKSKKNSGGKGL